MAEAIAKARLGAAISVMSAGAPKDSMSWGSPASPRTVEVMSRRGIDFSSTSRDPWKRLSTTECPISQSIWEGCRGKKRAKASTPTTRSPIPSLRTRLRPTNCAAQLEYLVERLFVLLVANLDR